MPLFRAVLCQKTVSNALSWGCCDELFFINPAPTIRVLKIIVREKKVYFGVLVVLKNYVVRIFRPTSRLYKKRIMPEKKIWGAAIFLGFPGRPVFNK
jgi:hypothetical protein